MKRVLPGSLLLFSLLVTAFAQNPTPSPLPSSQKEKEPQDEVVRINTNLVQVDVSVIDKDGKAVTDLTREEFEIKEDDRVQKITNFSYISSESPAATSSPGAVVDRNAPPSVLPSNLRPSQVKRTMALVVDDIGLAFESTEPVRNALRKFVDSQMQPGDLVAIIRTAGGMGVLQQFTSDKARLYAAINSIRWSPSGRTGATSAETTGGRYESTDEIKDLLEFRNEVLSVGTLTPLLYVIRGLKDLPGRKSLIFFSENLRVTSAVGRNDRLLNAMQQVADEANRASVVLYTEDASGLQPLNYTAADSPMPGTNNISSISLGGGGLSANHDTAEANLARLRALAERRNVEFETHTVLDYLAQRTGGIFTRFTNDLNTAIRSALEDQKSYYLIGYRPDESTFDPATGARRFHKWEIKVKRPGLKVRYRSGFYGVPDDNKKETSATPQAQLSKALVSPFVAGDLHVRLTSLFRGDASTPYVNSLIYIDGRDLTFKESADGWREAAIDVVAMTFGDNGTIVDQVGHTQTIRVRDDTYQRFLQNGLAYNLSVPVKKPGAYQLRVAVRDTATSRLGSASQFIEVPDLSKGRLSLSSIVITGSDPKAASVTPASSAAAQGEDQFEQQIGSAVRRLRNGMLLDYGYMIYNAQLDRAKGQPQVQTQIRLLRDGQEIFAGRVNQFDPSGQTDLKQLVAGGRLQVGTAMVPGQYILQVIVTDQLAKEKFRTATQWIDFEVVK